MRFEPPEVADRRVAVRVSAAAERHIRRGHPWVFDQSIESASHDAGPGDLAVVFDKRRDFLAIGLWDPASPIRIRVLHSGKPVTIDAAFWQRKVLDAVAARQSLLDDPGTNAFRALHGENDGFPGLVADCYDTTLVVKLYSEAWLPHLEPIVDATAGLLDCDTVIVRLGRLITGRDLHGLVDGGALVGVAPVGPVRFLEHGLSFDADVVAGQKTGHFLDQRDNRAMVGGLAADADVLDVFSCTGGFSVHAAAGGARSVTSVDIAAPALDSARHNMAINADRAAVTACTHRVVRADAFAAMGAAIDRGERYDIVVVDPPSFASRQSAVATALRAYGRLTRLAVALVADGGTLVQASCSSRITTEDFLAVVHGAAADEGVELGDAIVTGHAVDHPIGFPEGAYLKAIFARPRRGSF